MTPSSLLLSLFTEPSRAFAAIEERGRAWFPMSLLIALNIGLMLWYYQAVDFAWLQDYLVSGNPDLASPDARKAFLSFMTPSTMTWSMVGGTLIGVPLVMAVVALYYLLVGKAFALEHRYGQWFAFAAWCSMPGLLGLAVKAIQFLLSDNGQISPEGLNLLSLNELVLHLDNGHAWKTFADSIDLTMVWGLVLGVIGLKRWSGRGSLACAIAVALPYVLIFGIWAARLVASE
ncbi:MAG: YIP1 family protein [Gammaproteobacteria bacterium]|nr:YIP1 family protein [Gammaproteobacteria bacterium]